MDKIGVLCKNGQRLRSLHLTVFQAGILETVTPDKIAEASLLELAKTFGTMNKSELAVNPLKIGSVQKVLHTTSYYKDCSLEVSAGGDGEVITTSLSSDVPKSLFHLLRD